MEKDADGRDPSKENAREKEACPVVSTPEVYDVYSRLVDGAKQPKDGLSSRNAIPLGLHNRPIEGQRQLLSTERAVSTIPKGGTEHTWTYPSPQMFFNALKRKGKGDDVVEEDMDSVVSAHNMLNELTWLHVLNWERLHCDECSNPKLLKFQGRPDKLRARFYGLFKSEPFDRHDWVIDRCGRRVRYVIDFYFDEDKAGDPEAFAVDARPALDSFGAFHDRLKMSIYRVCAKIGIPCPVTGHRSSRGDGVNA